MVAKNFFKNNIWPIILTVITLIILSAAFYLLIKLLNFLPVSDKIDLAIRPGDVLVGLIVYLKTSIDFALLIGILMNRYEGLKNRIAIEVGTSIGNAVGTMLVLILWVLFKEVKWLLALMVLFASLVLLKLAKVSIEHIGEDNPNTNTDDNFSKPGKVILRLKFILESLLNPINKILDPFLSKIVPDLKFNSNREHTFKSLLIASFTIPFILGSDDFAGYVPLFNIVNIFGFGLGVFIGHTLLNIFLFLSPKATTTVLKNSFISIAGSIAFIVLALIGLSESIRALFG